jgi:Uma2 family endonuclease
MAEALADLPVLNDVDDFLAWAEGRPERWQFIEGRLVMMAGASDAHVIVAVNLRTELRARLRGTPCRPFDSDRLVRIGRKNGYFPDASVACRRADGTFDPDPVLVVEVLSPSTEKDDRGVKWRSYQRIAMLQHYLLLAQDEAVAELWTRDPAGGWRYEAIEGLDGTIRLGKLDIELPMAALYADVTLAPPEAEPEPEAAAG